MHKAKTPELGKRDYHWLRTQMERSSDHPLTLQFYARTRGDVAKPLASGPDDSRSAWDEIMKDADRFQILDLAGSLGTEFTNDGREFFPNLRDLIIDDSTLTEEDGGGGWLDNIAYFTSIPNLRSLTLQHVKAQSTVYLPWASCLTRLRLKAFSAQRSIFSDLLCRLVDLEDLQIEDCKHSLVGISGSGYRVVLVILPSLRKVCLSLFMEDHSTRASRYGKFSILQMVEKLKPPRLESLELRDIEQWVLAGLSHFVGNSSASLTSLSLQIHSLEKSGDVVRHIIPMLEIVPSLRSLKLVSRDHISLDPLPEALQFAESSPDLCPALESLTLENGAAHLERLQACILSRLAHSTAVQTPGSPMRSKLKSIDIAYINWKPFKDTAELCERDKDARAFSLGLRQEYDELRVHFEARRQVE